MWPWWPLGEWELPWPMMVWDGHVIQVRPLSVSHPPDFGGRSWVGMSMGWVTRLNSWDVYLNCWGGDYFSAGSRKGQEVNVELLGAFL